MQAAKNPLVKTSSVENPEIKIALFNFVCKAKPALDCKFPTQEEIDMLVEKMVKLHEQAILNKHDLKFEINTTLVPNGNHKIISDQTINIGSNPKANRQNVFQTRTEAEEFTKALKTRYRYQEYPSNPSSIQQGVKYFKILDLGSQGFKVSEIIIDDLSLANHNSKEFKDLKEKFKLDVETRVNEKLKGLQLEKKPNFEVYDFYTKYSADTKVLNFLRSATPPATGNALDVMKLFSHIKNPNTPTLQTDVNVKIYDYKAFYESLFVSPEAPYMAPIIMYDKNLQIGNKLTFTHPDQATHDKFKQCLESYMNNVGSGNSDWQYNQMSIENSLFKEIKKVINNEFYDQTDYKFKASMVNSKALATLTTTTGLFQTGSWNQNIADNIAKVQVEVEGYVYNFKSVEGILEILGEKNPNNKGWRDTPGEGFQGKVDEIKSFENYFKSKAKKELQTKILSAFCGEIQLIGRSLAHPDPSIRTEAQSQFNPNTKKLLTANALPSIQEIENYNKRLIQDYSLDANIVDQIKQNAPRFDFSTKPNLKAAQSDQTIKNIETFNDLKPLEAIYFIEKGEYNFEDARWKEAIKTKIRSFDPAEMNLFSKKVKNIEYFDNNRNKQKLVNHEFYAFLTETKSEIFKKTLGTNKHNDLDIKNLHEMIDTVSGGQIAKILTSSNDEQINNLESIFEQGARENSYEKLNFSFQLVNKMAQYKPSNDPKDVTLTESKAFLKKINTKAGQLIEHIAGSNGKIVVPAGDIPVEIHASDIPGRNMVKGNSALDILKNKLKERKQSKVAINVPHFAICSPSPKGGRSGRSIEGDCFNRELLEDLEFKPNSPKGTFVSIGSEAAHYLNHGMLAYSTISVLSTGDPKEIAKFTLQNVAVIAVNKVLNKAENELYELALKEGVSVAGKSLAKYGAKAIPVVGRLASDAIFVIPDITKNLQAYKEGDNSAIITVVGDVAQIGLDVAVVATYVVAGATLGPGGDFIVNAADIAIQEAAEKAKAKYNETNDFTRRLESAIRIGASELNNVWWREFFNLNTEKYKQLISAEEIYSTYYTNVGKAIATMFPDVKTVITSFPNIQELIECRTDLYNPSSETDFEHFESKLDIIRMCLGGENSELLNQDDIEQTCSQYKTTEGIKKVLVEELKKTQKVCTKDNDVYSRISTNIQEGTALAPSHEEGDLSLKLEESLKANNITLVSSINTANIYRKPLLLINTQKTLKSGGEVDNNFPSEYFTDFRFNLTHPNENEENYQQNGVKGLFPNFKDEPLFHQLRTEYADFENSFGALRFELPENNNLNITEIKETFPKQEAVMVFLTSKNNIYTPAKEDKSKNHVIIVTDIPFVETYNEKHEKEKISSLVNYNIQGVEGPIFFSAGGGIGGTIQASAEFENNADLYYNTIKEGKYVFNSFGNTIEFTNSNQTNILHNFAVLNLPANRRSSPGLDFNYETSTANPNILTKINNFESGDFSFTNKDSTPNSYLQEFDLFPGSKITLKGMTLPLNLKTSAEATNTFDINYSNYTEALILNLEGYEIHNITSIETKAELQKQGWNAENPELPNYRMIVDNTAIDLKDIDEQLLSIKFKNDVIFNPNLNKHSSGKNQALVYYDARNKTEEAKLKIENFRSIKNEKFNLIKYYKTNDEIFIIDERPGINIAQFTDPAIKKFNFELHGKENIIQAYPGQEITVRSIKAGQTMIDFRGLDGVTVESFNQASSENSTEYSSTLVAKNADGTEVAKIIVNNIKPNQKLNIWQKGKQIQQVDLTSGITINKHAAKKIVNSAPGAEISIINGEELLFNSYTGIEFPELTAEISYYKEKNDLVILGKNKDGKLLSFYITSFGNIEQKYNENNNYHLDFAFGYEEKSLEHIITKFNENKNLRNLNHYYKIEELPNDAIIDNREDQQNEIFVLPKFTDIKFEEVTLQDGIAPSLKITYANATTGVEKSFFVASIALNTFIQVGKDGDKININDIKEWSKKCYDIKNIKDLTNIEEELGENAAQKLEDLSKTAKEEYIEFLNSIQSQYGENTKNLIEKLQLNTKRIYKEYISPILTTAATTTITTPTTTTTTTTTPSTTTTTIPTTTTTTPTTTKTTTIATTTPSTTTSTTTTKKSTTTLSKEVQNIRKIQGLRNNHEFTKYYADGNTFEEIITYPLEGSGKINFYHVKPNQNESLNSFIRRLKQMPRPGNGAQIIGNYNRKTKVLVGFEASNIYRYSPSNPTNIYIINKGKDAEIQIVSDKITSYNIISKPDSNITFSSPKSAISITSSIFDYSKLNFPYKPLIDVDFVAKIQNYSFRFKLQDFYNVQNSGWQNPNFAPHNYKLYLADKNSKKEYRLYGLPQRALNAYSKQIEQNSGETLEGFTGRLASHSAENNNFLGMVYGYHGSGSEKTEVMVGLKDNELYKAKDENLHSYHFINKGNNNKFIANKVQFQEYWFTSEKNSSLTLFLETTNISPPFIATSNNDIAFILKFRDQFIKIFILDYLNNAKKFNFFIEANGEQRKVLDWNRQTFILAKDANILTLERNSEVNAEDLIKNLVTGIKFKDMPTNPQLVTIGNDLCITGGRNTCCINNFNKIKEKFTANNEYNLDLYYGLNAAAKPISQVINEYNQLPAPRNGKRAIEENLSQNSYKLRKPLGIEEKKESYNIIGEGFFENENDEFAHQDSATPRIDEGAMQNDSFLQTLNPFNLMSSAYNYLFNNTASTQNNNQPLLESNSFESNNISHSLPQQKLNGTLPLADLKVKMANISAEFLEGASDYILNHKTRPIELSKPELNGTLQLADLAVKTLNNKFFNKEASPFEELSKKIEKQGKFDKIKVFKPLSSELYEKEKNKILFNEVKERLKLVKNFNQLKELFPEFQTLEKQAFFKENPSPSEDKFNEMKEVLTQAKNLTQLEKTLKYFVKEAKDYISHELNKKPPVENEFEKFLRENKTIKFNEAQEQGRRF